MRRIILTICLLLTYAQIVSAGPFSWGPFSSDTDPATGDITLENSEKIDNGTNGTICLQGAGGTNNEDICFDLETTPNKVIKKSNTSSIDFGIPDLYERTWGSDSNLKTTWQTTGNDNFQIGTAVGLSTQSGYISIMERADIGNANRSPSGTSADPVLRVYSSDAAVAGDYIEMYHDQTNANINSGTGSIMFLSRNQIEFDTTQNDAIYTFKVDNSELFFIRADSDNDQLLFQLADISGNSIIISNNSGWNKDYDHATTTNPTLFIHSDTDPDTDNMEWGSFAHDKTDLVVSTGTGAVSLTTAVIINNFVAADPCGGVVYAEGALFYNSTSDYYCFCNGAGNDVKMDGSTACF